MIDQVPEEIQAEIKKNIPSGDFGDPENIYKAVKFLISANYVNGSSIDINGGLY